MHELALMPREPVLTSDVGDASVHTGVTDARLCHTPSLGVGRPGSVLFVSDRPGAYGRLLLAVYVRWQTGLLVSSDWLRPVTRGGWRTGFPEPVHGSVDVSWLGGGLYKSGLTGRWSFGCWLLTSLFVVPWTCWRLFDLEDCDSQRGRWCGSLQGCCALFRQSTVTDWLSILA